MTKKRRKGSRFSSFAKLFIRNETEYPAALDGQVTPWIAISKNNKKPAINGMVRRKRQKGITRGIAPKILDKKQVARKRSGLPRLDMQLKKARLLLILKSGKPPRKTKKSVLDNNNGAAQVRHSITSRAAPKIKK